MKKKFFIGIGAIVLLALVFTPAITQRLVLLRDFHPSVLLAFRDTVRTAVSDSLAALSADGVTIVNDGTFKLRNVDSVKVVSGQIEFWENGIRYIPFAKNTSTNKVLTSNTDTLLVGMTEAQDEGDFRFFKTNDLTSLYNSTLRVKEAINVMPGSGGNGSINLIAVAPEDGVGSYTGRGLSNVNFCYIDTLGVVRPWAALGGDVFHKLSPDSIPPIFIMLAAYADSGAGVNDMVSATIRPYYDNSGGYRLDDMYGFNVTPPLYSRTFTIGAPTDHPSDYAILGLHRTSPAVDSTNRWISFTSKPSDQKHFEWLDSTAANSTMRLKFYGRKGGYNVAGGFGSNWQMSDNNNDWLFQAGYYNFQNGPLLLDPGPGIGFTGYALTSKASSTEKEGGDAGQAETAALRLWNASVADSVSNNIVSNISGSGNFEISSIRFIMVQSSSGRGDIAFFNRASGTASDVRERFRITHDGKLISVQTYSNAVGGTNRDLYIDDTGLIGYVVSTRENKKNIKPIGSTDWLYNLNPVEFEYKDSDVRQVGLIAEEVEQVNSEFVSYDKEGKPETVSYSKLIPVLLKELQNQRKEIEQLKSRLR